MQSQQNRTTNKELKEQVHKEFTRRKQRQEYMKNKSCLSCGHTADHSKARTDGNGNSFMFTHQFENPAPEDFISDEEFIDSLIDKTVQHERERVVEMLKTDFPTAWKVLVTKKENHHEKCSWRVAGMLCDCAGQDVLIATVDHFKSLITNKSDINKHICCDGECYHDDCCGKVPENCPNFNKDKE